MRYSTGVAGEMNRWLGCPVLAGLLGLEIMFSLPVVAALQSILFRGLRRVKSLAGGRLQWFSSVVSICSFTRWFQQIGCAGKILFPFFSHSLCKAAGFTGL